MKKILSTILLIIAALSLVLMIGENPDGSVNLLWSGSWLAVFFGCAKAWERLNPDDNQKNSDMNYEEKYNAVVEAAKEFIDCGSSDVTDVIYKLFPQLKKTEEEKMVDTIMAALTGGLNIESILKKRGSSIEDVKSWLELIINKQTLVPATVEPYYIEGRGIYVPIINKALAMHDAYDGKEVEWKKAVEAGAPTKEDWYIILYFKDKINQLLKDNGGTPLSGYHWSSSESTQYTAWLVAFNNGGIYSYLKSTIGVVRPCAAF